MWSCIEWQVCNNESGILQIQKLFIRHVPEIKAKYRIKFCALWRKSFRSGTVWRNRKFTVSWFFLNFSSLKIFLKVLFINYAKGLDDCFEKQFDFRALQKAFLVWGEKAQKTNFAFKLIENGSTIFLDNGFKKAFRKIQYRIFRKTSSLDYRPTHQTYIEIKFQTTPLVTKIKSIFDLNFFKSLQNRSYRSSKFFRIIKKWRKIHKVPTLRFGVSSITHLNN